MAMVNSNKRPVSVGRFNRKRAPKGVTSTSRDISTHSWLRVSRQVTRTGSDKARRSRNRFDFLVSPGSVYPSKYDRASTADDPAAAANLLAFLQIDPLRREYVSG